MCPANATSRLRTAALAIASSLVALSVAAALTLGTATGRQTLLDAIARITASANFRLEMRGLKLGPIWSMERLAVNDTTGTWLLIEDLRLRPQLSALLGGRLSLHDVSVRRLDLDRLPATTKDSAGDASLPELHISGMDARHIRIGSAVMGHEAVFSLRGGIEMNPDKTHARLRVARLDRTEDHAELDALLGYRDRVGSMQLELREAQGGLIHSFLGLNSTEGISLQMAGTGPMDHWLLTIEARISDAARLEANTTLDVGGDPSLALRASLSPGPSWTEITGLPDGEILAEGHGFWRNGILHLTRLDLQGRPAMFQGNATWDFESDILDAQIQARSYDLSSLLPAKIKAGPVTANVRLRRDTSGLNTLARMELQDWDLSGQTIASAAADITLHMPADLRRWEAQANVDAQTPDLPRGLQAWKATAVAEGNATRLWLHEIRLDAGLLGLEGNATLDTDMVLRARTVLHKSDDQPISAILESELRGAMDRASQTLAGHLAVNATGISGMPPVVQQLLGDNGRITANLDLSPDLLNIRDVLVQFRSKADLHGEIDMDTGRFSAEIEANLPDLAWESLRVGHGTSVRGSLSGWPQSFDMALVVQSPRLAMDKAVLDSISGTAALNGLPGLQSATLQAKAAMRGQPMSLNLRTQGGTGALQLEEGVLQLPGTMLQASGQVTLDIPQFDGTLNLSSTDLRPLGQVLDVALAGKMEVRANLDYDKNRHSVRLEGRGEGLDLLGTRIDSMSLKGLTAIPGPMRDTDVHLEFGKVFHPPLRADLLDVHLRGADQGLSFQADVREGASKTQIRSGGQLELDPFRLLVESFNGQLLGQDLRLASPLDLRISAPETSWNECALHLGPARFSSQGSMTPARTDIRADVRDMDPAMLHALWPHLPSATMHARLEVKGSPQDPFARLVVQGDSILMQTAGLENLPELVGNAEIMLDRDSLNATALVSANGDVRLEGQLSGPVMAELFSVSLRNDSPLSGRITGFTDLHLLPHFLHLDDQSLEGRCDLDFRMGGTWSAPSLTGTAQTHGARYENFRSGTMIQGIDLDASATGSHLELKATGTDGDKGRLQAQGSMDLDTLTYAFGAHLDNCRLLRMDLAQASASGNVGLRGSPSSGMALDGLLTIDPSQFRIPSAAPPDVVHIEVREINAPVGASSKVKPQAPFRIDLDLGLQIPARMIVKGRGLDSEWYGQLHIHGNQNSPVINGQVDLLRGKLEFLDRIFDLTKGSLNFSGNTPPNPLLDVVGEVHVLETQIQVHVTGSANSPRVTLSSIPALPQDELLAMILFGRSARQISPLQAVRLAQAAAEMTGLGTGPDVLDNLKSSLGLQEVEFSQDDKDNTAVGIGAYWGGKYYIRTERSVSGQDRTKVEVQLTPKISVETEVGGDSREGGGVNWKHDY